MKYLTKKQYTTYLLIKEQNRLGLNLTFMQMVVALNVNSVGTIHERLQMLVKKGCIKNIDGKYFYIKNQIVRCKENIEVKININ